MAGAIETVLFIAMVLGLASAPLWLGSNRLLAWGLNGVMFPGIVVLYELSRLLLDQPHAVSARRILIPATLFGAVIVWIGIQMSTLVPHGLAHPIWSLAAGVLEAPVPASVSVNPQASALALLRLLTDASVFWLALQLCRQPRRAYLLQRGVSFIVTVYAAFGLIATAFLSGAIPVLDGPSPGLVRSTFVNRNTFATYAGLGMVVTATLILQLYREIDPSHGGPHLYRGKRLLEITVRKGWFLIGSGLIILVAMLGTGSRGGVLAAALGLGTVMILSFSGKSRSIARQFEPIGLITIALALAFIFYGDVFVGHIATSGLDDANRIAVYQIVIRSILDAPWLGYGYGSFSDVFPMYRDQSISTIGVWDKAHNSYLEVWQGLGLIFGTALIAVVAWPLAQCFLGANRRRRDAASSIAASGAGLLLAVHSLVDFSLQVQAISLTFMALLGAGLAQSESSRNVTSD